MIYYGFYLAVTRLLTLLAPAAGFLCGLLPGSGPAKVARGVRGRREAHDRLGAWGRSRDRTRPLVWFHASSAGEAQQAGAVMAALAGIRPKVDLVFTHFSPSAEAVARDLPAGHADYLPWDVPSRLRPALAALEPALMTFVKNEVWPALAWELAARHVPTTLVAGAVAPGAGRLTWPTRQLLRPAWRGLSLCLAIGQDDASRLIELGVPFDRAHVAGDPGVDGAAQRVADSAPPGLEALPVRPMLVAGSTWPADEKLLVRALGALRASRPEVLCVIVPHEPSPRRVRSLCRRLRRCSVTCTTLDGLESDTLLGDSIDAVVVDRVGVLAGIYPQALVAYVGGGLGRRGLHSVVEPAAARLPVLFGPRHERAPAAASLVRSGAGFVVSDPGELGAVLVRLFLDGAARRRASQAAANFVDRERGAARKTAELLAKLLDEQVRA